MAIPVFSTGDVPTATQVNNWFVNEICVVKAGNTSRASTTTLADDPDLVFSVDANTKYRVTMMLLVAAQVANDFKMDFTLPAGASFNYAMSTQTTGAAVYSDDQIFPVVAGTSTAIGGLAGVGSAVGMVDGLLAVAGTAGTFKLQWAQLVSGASATSLMANSWLEARRVG